MTDPRTYNTRPIPGRIEDVEWLTETDESLSGAAHRLSITAQALQRWLEDHGHDDLLRRLQAREDQRPRGLRHLRVATADDSPTPEADLVTAQELCQVAGITYRQLDYWTRTGRLIPYTQATPGSGNARMYERHEADVARMIALLLDAGLNVDRAFTAARQLADGPTARLGVFTLTPIPGDG